MGEPSDRPGVIDAEEQQLRRFFAARDAGNDEAMIEAGKELLVVSLDRIKQSIRLHGRNRLRPQEFDDAESEAYARFLGSFRENFRGTSMGEYAMALHKLCWFAVETVVRRNAKHNERHVSIDKTFDDGEGGRVSALDPELAEIARQQAEREADKRYAHAAVGDALSRLPNERQRIVLERSLAGDDADDIAADLNVTIDNLYQLRHRGMNAVGKLIGAPA